VTDTGAAAPDASTVTVVQPLPDGGTAEVKSVTSNRSWFGALFASGDMSVDSLIVCMFFSVVAYWFLCGYEIVVNHTQLDPLVLGGGFAAMLAAFAGGKTARDWRRGPDGQG